jgi:hypothetical protein
MSQVEITPEVQNCIDCMIGQIRITERLLISESAIPNNEKEIRRLEKSLINLNVEKYHYETGDYKHIEQQKRIDRFRQYDEFGTRRKKRLTAQQALALMS